MANKIHKGKLGRETSRTLSTPAVNSDDAISKGQVEEMTAFTATANQHGTHPAFNSQNEAIIWLLGNSTSGGATTLNSPEPITATSAGGDSIDINWTDTNS